MLSKEELIAFEEEMGECFTNKQILAPMHLDNGNEDQLIEIFKMVKSNDWVCCSWRSHYKCLLKGVPKELLKEKILQGKSIGLCFKDYNIISSAIVAGILPISVGIAWTIKQKGEKRRVWCFLGDTTAETGVFHECWKYSCAWHLPIKFIIEDNNLSVCTDTRKVWNNHTAIIDDYDGPELVSFNHGYVFKYKSKYPHAGTGGKRIQF